MKWKLPVCALLLALILTCGLLDARQDGKTDTGMSDTGMSGKSGLPTGRVKMNVFAILSDNLNEHAMLVSSALKEQTGLESFPSLGFQIHCTLYMTQYENDKVESVKNLVASVTQGIHPFEVKTTGLHATKDNWLFINLDRNRNLQTLADLLAKALSPLRSANQPVPSWLESYPEKLEYFKQYGSPNVFNQFEPHLTLLAKTEGTKVPEFVEKNKADAKLGSPQTGMIVGVGIAIADGAGQMKEKLAVFPLK